MKTTNDLVQLDVAGSLVGVGALSNMSADMPGSGTVRLGIAAAGKAGQQRD